MKKDSLQPSKLDERKVFPRRGSFNAPTQSTITPVCSAIQVPLVGGGCSLFGIFLSQEVWECLCLYGKI